MSDELPPLKTKGTPGGPFIPTFSLVFSGATVTKTGPTEATVDLTNVGSGGAGVPATRAISTLFPLAGGGDLSVDRTHSVSTAGFLVLSSRTINTTAPLAGGGNLGGDLTLTANTAVLVTTGRQVLSGLGLTGGGNLSADITLVVNTVAIVGSQRAINTTAPLAGGGNLSADRTLTVDTLALVGSGRLVTASTGLTGGGDLSADRILSVNTNVRDKSVGFYFSGALATTSLAANARIYIPFNMQLLQVRLAAKTAPTGESIIINPLQYSATLAASTALFASTNRPMVVGGSNVGSDNATFAIGNLFTGSWLGVDLNQVGATNAGSDLTITFIVRSS